MARRSRSGRQPPEPGTPGRGGNAAEFMTMTRSLPSSLIAGHHYEVAITMRNSGTTVWRADGHHPYRLGSQNPQDTTQWGFGRVDVPCEVHPGAEATFSFGVVAPEAPGCYHFQWRMVQDGVGWFGTPSHDILVRVDRPPVVRQDGRDRQRPARRSDPFRSDLSFAAI